MKERLVKGTSLVQIVRSIRSHRREHALPALGDWERDLLRRRISPSTWYSLKVYESLLQTVHRYVLDGSEAAAEESGKKFARTQQENAELGFLVPGNPAMTLSQLGPQWVRHFNFGELTLQPWPRDDSTSGASICLSGFPDMSAALGHAIMGFTEQLVELSGGSNVAAVLEERPWMHHSVLRFTLTWT